MKYKRLRVGWDITDEQQMLEKIMNEPDKLETNEKIEGYWYSKHEPDYPIPITNKLNEKQANDIYILILEKEKLANQENYCGYSTSRITGENLGNIEYNFNDWCWTGDFAKHYVLEHKVKPTDEFLEFIGYPNEGKTKAITKIRYNGFKKIVNSMVDGLSEEIDK